MHHVDDIFLEGTLPKEEFVGQSANLPHIDPTVVFLILQLFGAQVDG